MRRRFVPGRIASGFTLIEVLVYLALYAIMFSGAVAAIYTIIETSARSETSALIEEEGDFLLAKIDAASAQGSAVAGPAGTSSSLSITESDGTLASFRHCGAGLCERVGSMALQQLNDPDTSVVGLTFVVDQYPDAASDAMSISASFTLAATTSDGHALSRNFSTLDYVHL